MKEPDRRTPSRVMLRLALTVATMVALLAASLVAFAVEPGNASELASFSGTSSHGRELAVHGVLSAVQDPSTQSPAVHPEKQRAEALARDDAAIVAQLAGAQLSTAFTEDALIAGTYPESVMQEIAGGLQRGRAWFDRTFDAPRGIELFDGRLAELYVFEKDEEFFATLGHFASLSATLPSNWIDAVKGAHGFFFADPFPLSCARLWKRPEGDLIGHCYHHWGHLLVDRLEYDGRLLPPWYEEGIAALVEFRSHDRNAVFCHGYTTPTVATGDNRGPTKKRDTSTKAAKTAPAAPTSEIDPRDMSDGRWKDALRAALEAKKPTQFSELVARQFNELELSDITAAMGIVEWLESKDALRAFHAELRRAAPRGGMRVIEPAWERDACYEKAFQAAVKMSWKDADQAWRQWFLTK